MRLLKLIAVVGLTLITALALPAQTVRVIFTSGTASIQRPDEAAARAIVKGESVIIGSRIVTGPDGRVVLTPMPGVKSIVAPNTTLLLESVSENRTSPTEVTHQAVIDLKEGSVVSDLQKPDGVTYDYSIRTARGLAGARGTNYTVAINSAGIETVLVSHGSITFNLLNGSQVSVTAGQIQITDASGVRTAAKLSDLSEADQAFAQEVAEATLGALEAAVAGGVEINPEAISQALDLFESFGLDVSESTLQRIDELREALDALMEEPTGDESTIITETTEEEGTLESFIASLDSAQATALQELITNGEFNTADDDFLAKFAQPQFTSALLETVNLYLGLTVAERNQAVTLGILGDANTTAIGAQSTGLTSLLAFYTNEDLGTPIIASAADYSSSSTTLIPNFAHIFFPGSESTQGFILYNALFDSSPAALSNLYIGATRELLFENTATIDSEYTNFIVASGKDLSLRAADLVSLKGLAAKPVTFSADIRGITIQSYTINLANVNFPEGSLVALNSFNGGLYFNTSVIGGVNFLGGVFYGENLLNSLSAFNAGSRGNIAIGSLASPVDVGELTYIPVPPTPYEQFRAGLNIAQTSSFDEILTDGEFNTTDSVFLAKFAQPQFTAALLETINLYLGLNTFEKAQAVTLGILGNANTTAIGANSDGLASLLSFYANLATSSSVDLRSEAIYNSSSTTELPGSHIFFPGSESTQGFIIYNALFNSSADTTSNLYIGATRELMLENTAGIIDVYTNFLVASGNDLHLRSADLVSLRGLISKPITFSADIHGIVMQSYTINLLNVNFPEGSVVALNSFNGGLYFNTSVIGGVNFLGGVFYGDYLLDSQSAFDTYSRGNIAIGTISSPVDVGELTYTPVPPTPFEQFRLDLTTDQRDLFDALPDPVQQKIFNLNDPDITGTVLAPDPVTDVPYTSTSINRILDAYIALSADARVFVKIMGGATGTGLTDVEATPYIEGWSAQAIADAATVFNSNLTIQSTLISLGAGDAIIGVNADYIQGMLIAASSDITSLTEAGWGRYLQDIVNDSALADVVDAAQDATTAQRALIKLLDIQPFELASVLSNNAGDPQPIYDRLDYIIGNVSTNDLNILASVGFNSGFQLFASDDITTVANLNTIVTNYNSLDAAQQKVARTLRLGSLLLDDTDATTIITYYNSLPPTKQEAFVDTDLVTEFYDSSDFAATQGSITSALNAYLGLSSKIQNYLLSEAEHFDLLPILTSTGSTDNEGRSSRSLANIVSLLNTIAINPTDYDTLLDMDLGRAVVYQGYLEDIANLNPNDSYTDGASVLFGGINFYQSLPAGEQRTLRELGIIGSDHVGVLGEDYTGVQRLLTAYAALPIETRVDTQQIDEKFTQNQTYSGHTSYFFPFNKNTDGMVHPDGAMVNVAFASSSDLYVGAVRRLHIDNTGVGSPNTTFSVAGLQTYVIKLRAGDLIHLNGASYSSNAAGIVMDAITINLANFNFREGSVAALNSLNGGTANGSDGSGIYPNWGGSIVGRVNFLNDVTYGGLPLQNTTQFDTNARGNIAIGSHTAPASLPTYTPPVIN